MANESRRPDLIAFSLQGVFLSTALLVWSLYDYVTNGSLGLPFLLFAAGAVMHWAAYLYLKKKS